MSSTFIYLDDTLNSTFVYLGGTLSSTFVYLDDTLNSTFVCLDDTLISTFVCLDDTLNSTFVYLSSTLSSTFTVINVSYACVQLGTSGDHLPAFCHDILMLPCLRFMVSCMDSAIMFIMRSGHTLRHSLM